MRCWFVPMRPVTPFMTIPTRRTPLPSGARTAPTCSSMLMPIPSRKAFATRQGSERSGVGQAVGGRTVNTGIEG